MKTSKAKNNTMHVADRPTQTPEYTKEISLMYVSDAWDERRCHNHI